jgi:AmiR/NasT family two-component response regulator
VKSVVGWALSGQSGSRPALGQAPPQIMLLDISSDTKPYFASAVQFRRLNPGGCIVACWPWEPSPDLLVQAMRAGVNESLLRPIDPVMLQSVLKHFIQQHGGAGTGESSKLIV